MFFDSIFTDFQIGCQKVHESDIQYFSIKTMSLEEHFLLPTFF